MDESKKDLMELLSQLNKVDFSYQMNKRVLAGKKIEEYIDFNTQSLQTMHGLMIGIVREFIEQNTNLKSRVIQLEEQIEVLKKQEESYQQFYDLSELRNKSNEEFQDWTRERFEGQDRRFTSNEEFQDWSRERFEGQDRRFTSNEEFQDWARERFEGQDRRFTSNEEFQDWSRERFEGQDRRFTSNEEFQDWARERFEGQDRRFTSNEEFQDWVRERFEGQDERFSGIEEREDWTRKRFESQDIRFEGIEERENWTRGRFNEAFDRLYRLDEITNYSIRTGKLQVPMIEENGYCLNQLMLNNRMFWMATEKNAQDDISVAAKEGRLSCGNVELLQLFNGKGTFLDLGANIGVFSLGFASQGWKGIAFEAGKHNYEVLQTSLEKNAFDVSLYNKAISDKTGMLYFYENGPWGQVVKSDEEVTSGIKMEALALDDFINEAKDFSDTIDLIKVDIEGSEVAAIRGMRQFLEAYSYPCMYVEVNVYTLSLQGESPFSLYDEMRALGYQAYDYEDGIIYEHTDEFPKEYCEDRLFIHVSQVEKFDIREKRCVGKDKNRENILKHLTELLNEQTNITGAALAHHSYVCSLLQHYPEFYQNEQITSLLKQIKEERKEDTYLMHSLAWLQN